MARLRSFFARKVVAGALILPIAFASFPVSAPQAAGETRSLKVTFIHTGEKAEIVFKRNGRFDPKGLDALNRILRDWRRNEPTKMDPRLFDLVWEVYRAVGAKDYIHVVSAYRSPATNNMLRSRTSGVAENSQHMLGKAMDFYIPGVPLKTLRATAMKFQVGGVGYYPKSGSPFVHLDVGSVRAWPRMSRQELVQLFPNGKTLHIPTDGKPLPGYQQAMAEYKSRVSSTRIEIASTGGSSSSSSGQKKNLLTALFGGRDKDEPAAPARQAPARAAPAAKPAQPVMTAEVRNLPGSEMIAPPVPPARPALAEQPANGGLATALYSPPRNTAQEALASAMPEPRPQAAAGTDEFADLQTLAVPVPELLGPRGMRGDAEPAPTMTASISPVAPDMADAVPLPADRPAAAESLLAAAEVGLEAEEDAAEQEMLSPAVVAALAESGAEARRSLFDATVATAEMAPAATVAEAPAAPAEKPATMEMASLMPTPAPRPAGRFGDVFDTPQPVATAGIAAGLPQKGGRPQQAHAAIARQAMSSGTSELTQDKLEQWAFARSHSDSQAGAFKVQRVVARALATDAGAGYKPQQLQVDPDRFSGSAPVLTVNIP